MENTTIIAAIIATAVGAKWLLGGSNKYAPGPWSPVPYIRNALQIPTVKPWVQYAEWANTYGSSVNFARAFGQKLLILNSYDDAIELLETRARNTSDRPPVVLFELMGLGGLVSITRYGDLWRKGRKLLHQSMKQEGAALESYRPVIEEGAKRLVRRLIEAGPEVGRKSLSHCQLYSGESIISLTYGYKLTDPAVPPLIKDIAEVVETASNVTLPGAYLVSIVPALRHLPSWMPGGSFHPVVKGVKAEVDRVNEVTYNFAKETIRDSQSGLKKEGKDNENTDSRMAPVESMVEQWLKAMSVELQDTADEPGQKNSKLEAIINDTALTSFTAGYDTTASSLSWFIIAMAKYPDVQKKAQDAILNVLGPNTLPTFQDRQSLPYLEAIYMEALRWGSPTPLGVPHSVVEDDIYNGYLIPAGTIILPNIWAMTRDETRYPNPEEFMPERFLNEDGSVKYDERILAYGFGRRICVGKHLASDTFWMAMATILATLHIGKDKDEQGNELEVLTDSTSELIVHPTKMRCSISKRPGVEI